MAKDKKEKEPGFDYAVPGPDELRPHQRDCDPSKGALAYALPHHHVMDVGAPPVTLPDGSTTTGTPASAQFTAGEAAPAGTMPKRDTHIPDQPGIVKRS